MGWLTDLLTFPVSAPVKTMLWVAETLTEQAENELYSADKIRAQLTELELKLDLGEISESEYEEVEEILLERLKIARQRLAERGEGV